MSPTARRSIAAPLGVIVTALAAVLLAALASVATGGGQHEPTCEDATIRVVDYTTPAVPEVWANFAPSNSKATFVGPAIYPTDPRGKWIVHSKIPGGHAGPDGVYAKGNPAKGGNWFYRHAGSPEVKVYKDIPNPDYPCETDDPTPTLPPGDDPSDPPTDDPTPTVPTDEPTPTVPVTPVPTTPTVPEPTEPYGGCDEAYLYPGTPGYEDCFPEGTPTPTEPPITDSPDPEPGEPTREVRCLGGSLDITITDAEGNIDHRSIAGAAQCQPEKGAPPVKEEGF